MALDALSKFFLSLTSVVDSYGAMEWDFRLVAFVTALVLIPIYQLAGFKGGVEWHGLIHALITGLGSLLCVYLDFYASEELTGKPEPLNMVQCGGPMTSLHHILPAITLGYSVLDLYNGFYLGKIDFILHGFATAGVMWIFCALNSPQTIVQMLVMEVSTIFLTMKDIKLGPTAQLFMQVMFALAFFLCRILLAPYVYFKLVIALVNDRDVDCFHPFLMPSTILFGAFFHTLNFYWFILILRKIKRMLSGEKKRKKGE